MVFKEHLQLLLMMLPTLLLAALVVAMLVLPAQGA
jgi:hypothetical protein